MTVTVDDLALHLGFAVTPTDTEALERALGTARGVIWPYLTSEPADGTDAGDVLDSCVLTIAADEWRRKDTNTGSGGTYAFADATDMVARLPYDQLRAVWPKLIAAGLATVVVA